MGCLWLKTQLLPTTRTHSSGPLLNMLVKGLAMHGPEYCFDKVFHNLQMFRRKSEKWFRQVFPNAAFNRQRMTWEFESGERLLLRHIARPDDYWNYHGHEIQWIGFEELTSWPTPECYTRMFACCRSSTKGIPRMVRATTNPYGAGHSWVKDRFQATRQMVANDHHH